MSMYFQYEKSADHIVTLTMDQEGRSANLAGQEFAAAFAEVVERLAKEEALAGVILTSAKETFMAGGDIDFLYRLTDPAEAFQFVESAKATFRKFETLGKPTVAAINGAALGGGLELALTCHHRIALDHPKSQLGLPEVTLGLLPGGGGVTRLPRILGIQAALPLLLEGTKLRPKEALGAGLVHELAASRDEMMARARSWIAENPVSVQPWDTKGYRMPGGDASKPAILQMLTAATPMLTQKTRGNFPAPQAILNAVAEGVYVDFDTASRIESRYFASLAVGKVAKNMISAFWYQLNAINAGSSRPKGFPQGKVKKVGILGAGMMGAGIAYSSAVTGIAVVLKDVSLEAAEKGKSYSDKLLSKKVGKGQMAVEEKEKILSRILPTASAQDLQGCDLVIEAVFENRELKAAVTQEAEEQIATDALFASNTSTLPITGLAEASKRPDNFIGLHFFSPVDKMQLVEIIVGKKTSDETLARSFDFVRQIRKTPIVVNDKRNFYTSRVFKAYVKEGLTMVGEGQHPRAVEQAAMQAGMAVGPLVLVDEVSLGLYEHQRREDLKGLAAEGKTLRADLADAVAEKMLHGCGRPGKAAGKGFYEYPEGGKKYLWPDLAKHFAPASEKLSQTEMMERLMFVQALDAVRCLDEGVVRSVADANIGSLFGWSFAPFKGGVLQYINDYGLKPFVARAKELASRYGDRFAPPRSLEEKAEQNEVYR